MPFLHIFETFDCGISFYIFTRGITISLHRELFPERDLQLHLLEVEVIKLGTLGPVSGMCLGLLGSAPLILSLKCLLKADMNG